jgi:hypothetical protein
MDAPRYKRGVCGKGGSGEMAIRAVEGMEISASPWMGMEVGVGGRVALQAEHCGNRPKVQEVIGRKVVPYCKMLSVLLVFGAMMAAVVLQVRPGKYLANSIGKVGSWLAGEGIGEGGSEGTRCEGEGVGRKGEGSEGMVR